jgi:hypothetical protein
MMDDPGGSESGATAVIEIDHLTRRFGSLTAVDNLTLSVKAGEVFALLGANGAGQGFGWSQQSRPLYRKPPFEGPLASPRKSSQPSW